MLNIYDVTEIHIHEISRNHCSVFLGYFFYIFDSEYILMKYFNKNML